MKRYLPVALLISSTFYSICVYSLQHENINVTLAETVTLTENAHVCNSETETQRLADNDQLREMAKALVEFKPTKYCFILPATATVQLLERHTSYIKFDYKSQILFTFGQYVQAEAIAQTR
ncbi:hypothetical protein [Rheinheimera maricola]|uniref:DUF4359 domain-containing protein n=1 Tax=Rheinheimera maricola TaxID=2793282 RepID=A0ABS7X9M3_9GAMM|nr:hypothetical protein [Rheinheimera maricola]MBZ9612258.1 hypothetical protein [Rheinheimera maricola]